MHSLSRIQCSLCPLRLALKTCLTCLLHQISLWLFAFQSPGMNRTSFCDVVLGDFLGLHRTDQLQLLWPLIADKWREMKIVPLSPFLIWKKTIIFWQLSVIITKPDFVKSMKLGKKKWFLTFDNTDHLSCYVCPSHLFHISPDPVYGTGDISENRELVHSLFIALYYLQESSMESLYSVF